MTDIINLDDFRKPEPEVKKPDSFCYLMEKPAIDLDAPVSKSEQATFAKDTIADQWANDLVHEFMKNFNESGEIDLDDPVYGKLMQGLADIACSMTRHHLDVIDPVALMLKKYPDGEVSVGVMTQDERGDNDV